MKNQQKENSFLVIESDPASKGEILKAALSLFVRQGPKDPTAREIAAQAGYSNPAIFKYFRTKDKLVAYLFRLCYERVTNEFREAIDLKRPLNENVIALLGAFKRIVEQDLDAFLYATENHRRFCQSLPAQLRKRNLGGLLRQILENGKSEGLVRRDADTELLATAIIGVLSQFARLLYFGEFQGPADHWIISMERMILKMCE